VSVLSYIHSNTTLIEEFQRETERKRKNGEGISHFTFGILECSVHTTGKGEERELK